MRSKTQNEIVAMLNEMAHARFISITDEDIMIEHGFDPYRKDLPPIKALGESISEMADCNAVMFWDFCCYDCNYRGCNIEHEVAKKYGLKRYNYNSITKEVEVLE